MFEIGNTSLLFHPLFSHCSSILRFTIIHWLLTHSFNRLSTFCIANCVLRTGDKREDQSESKLKFILAPTCFFQRKNSNPFIYFFGYSYALALVGCSPWGSQTVERDWMTITHSHPLVLHCNSNLTSWCSCSVIKLCLTLCDPIKDIKLNSLSFTAEDIRILITRSVRCSISRLW